MIVKGFVLDDERLKQGQYLGKDYFDDLLVAHMGLTIWKNAPEGRV